MREDCICIRDSNVRNGASYYAVCGGGVWTLCWCRELVVTVVVVVLVVDEANGGEAESRGDCYAGSGGAGWRMWMWQETEWLWS